MPEQSNNRKLYDNLLSTKKVTVDEIGDFDTFNSNMADQNLAKKLYTNLKAQKGFTDDQLGDENTFLGNLDQFSATRPEEYAIKPEAAAPEAAAPEVKHPTIEVTSPELSFREGATGKAPAAPVTQTGLKADPYALNIGEQFKETTIAPAVAQDLGGIDVMGAKGEEVQAFEKPQPLTKAQQLKADYYRKQGREDKALKIEQEAEYPKYEDTWFGDALEGIMGTASRITSNVAALQNMPTRVALNQYATSNGLDPKARNIFVDTFIANSPVTGIAETARVAAKKTAEEFDKKADRYKGKDFVQLIKEKDYSAAAGDIFLQGAKSLPYMIAAGFGGGAGLATIGLTEMAGKYQELDQIKDPGINADPLATKEYLNKTNMSELQKVTNSALTGAAEALTEYIGSVPFGKWISSAIAKTGAEGAKQALQKGLSGWSKQLFDKYGLLIGPVGEGLEEFTTAVATNAIDKYTGANPDVDLTEGAGKAFVYGMGGGAYGSAFAAPFEIASKREQYRKGRAQAEQIIRANFDALAQPDGKLHTGVDKQGNQVIIVSQTPGGMAILHDGRTVDISEIQDVQADPFEVLYEQQISEFDALFNPDLQQPDIQAQTTFNWNGRNMQLFDVSDKDNLVVREIDAEGEPVGRPEVMSQEQYLKIVEQQVQAPEATPELRTYNVEGRELEFTPTPEGEYFSPQLEGVQTAEEAQSLADNLEAQIGKDNVIRVSETPAAGMTPASYSLVVRPRTELDGEYTPKAPEKDVTEQLFKEGEEVAKYELKGQPIERGKALARVKAAIFDNNKAKIEDLVVSGDKEIQDMIDKAFPKPPAKFTIGKKKATSEDALNWIDAADNLEELKKLKIENGESAPDVRDAYVTRIKDFVPQVTEQEMAQLTGGLFAEEAPVADITEQLFEQPKETEYDQGNITGLPSREPRRETAEQAGPDQGRGREEITTGGDVQGNGRGRREERVEEVETRVAAEEPAGKRGEAGAPVVEPEERKPAFSKKTPNKEQQLEIILSANKMTDEVHTGIRELKDIKTAEEAFSGALTEGYDPTPDFKLPQIKEALSSGEITVYSSKPMANGVFITPSKIEAQNYAGKKEVYSERVKLSDVAWIDEVEGQLAYTTKAAAEERKPAFSKKATLPNRIAARLTDDGKGNFVFIHYAPGKQQVLSPKESVKEPSRASSQSEVAAKASVGGVVDYYAEDIPKEANLRGDTKHSVVVPKEKVYYLQEDPLNFYDEAKRQFSEKYPDRAFDGNYQAAWIAKVAADNGYEMLVSDWSKGLIGKSVVDLIPTEEVQKLKPGDKELKVGDIVEVGGQGWVVEEVGKPFISLTNGKQNRTIPAIRADVMVTEKETRDVIPEQRSSLTKEELLNTLETGEFAMLSGENPNNKQATPADNRAFNAKAENWFADKGLKYEKIKGKYDRPENSFLVLGMTPEQAIEFAKEFGQESVAHSTGLIFQDGTIQAREEGLNTEIDYNDPEANYFSTIKTNDGEIVAFSLNYGEERRPAYQAKKLYAGKVKAPTFNNLGDLAKWLQKWSAKNAVFSDDISKVSDDEFVKQMVKHTMEEVKALESVEDYSYIGFYDYDIPVRLNPELQRFANKRYGRELTEAEVVLYHLVAGFASPNANPVFDSSKGLDVFDRYMRTGELSAKGEKQATVWKVGEKGGKPVDTGVPKFDEEGKPVLSKISIAYAEDSLIKFIGVLDKFDGDLNKAINWITTKHSYEDISEMMDKPVKGDEALSTHENLSKEEGGFGIFGFVGPKLGSYVLNRIGEFSTVTKDMWYARTMARLTGEPLQDKKGDIIKLPWNLTKEGLRKRVLADKAWTIAAKKLGTTPADIQQRMWEFEKRLYSNLGATKISSDTGYASEGFLKRAKELEPDLYSDDVQQAAEQVNTEPTEAQKAAGNYQKGHVTLQGMDISIENPKGSTRSGVDEDGQAWETEMKSHYGYFKNSKGKDGDNIDVFIGDNPESRLVFVVDQINPKTDEFDESKVMLGYETAEEAKAAYLSNYAPDWKGFSGITEVTSDDFKEWLYDGAKQRKPFRDYASREPAFSKRLFHGSRAEFDKFSLDKIGTGEGMQAFGWGLYFTELEDIAKSYAGMYKPLGIKTKSGESLTFEEIYQKYRHNEVIRRRTADVEEVGTGIDTLTDMLEQALYIKKELAVDEKKIEEINKELVEVIRKAQETGLGTGLSSSEWKDFEEGNYKTNRVYELLRLKKEGGNAEAINAELKKIADEQIAFGAKRKELIAERTKLEKKIYNLGGKGYDAYPYASVDDLSEAIDFFKDAEVNLAKNRYLYDVEVHGGKTPDQYKFMDWYEPVPVEDIARIEKQAREEFGERNGFTEWYEAVLDSGKGFKDITGKQLYEMVVPYKLWQVQEPKDVSQFLLRAGIDGIRYPAQSVFRGKDAKPKGYNYVVFDENAVAVQQRIAFSLGRALAELPEVDLVKTVINELERTANQQTPTHVVGNADVIEVLEGKTKDKYIREVAEAEWYGVTVGKQILIHKDNTAENAVYVWAHEKAHDTVYRRFKSVPDSNKFFADFYDKAGPATIRRVIPEEYWFSPKETQADEYIAYMVQAYFESPEVYQSAPQWIKNYIFGVISEFTNPKNIEDATRNIALARQGKTYSSAHAGQVEPGRPQAPPGDRAGREAADRGGLRQTYGLEGIPAFEILKDLAPRTGTIKVDGIDRPVQNSKGQVIHPTRSGIENFWRWFGDSKVVDAEGRPLVVYHGTNANFEKFEPTEPNFYAVTEGTYFFTDSEKVASNFGKNIISAYLNINNPTELDGRSAGRFSTWSLYDDSGNYGFIVKNSDTGGGFATEYAVENPTQIKSATGNLGTFDPDDARIAFSRKPKLTVDKKQVQTTGEHLQELIVNNKLALKNWMDDVLTVVPKIEDYENPLLKDALAKSKVTTKLTKFEKGPYKRLINAVSDVMRTGNLSKEELSHYLIAVHGKERNERFWNAKPERVGEDFSGLTELKDKVRASLKSPVDQMILDGMNLERFADYYKEQIESKLSKEQVKELWDSITSISKLIRDEMLDSGMISKDYYDELNRMYKNYIPLRAWENQNPEEFEFSRGVGEYTSPIIQAKGRKSLADDPLATLLQMANTAYITGERNRVKQAAGELVRNNTKELKDFVQYSKVYFVDSGAVDPSGNPIITETIERPDQALFDAGKVTTKVPKEYTKRRTSEQAKDFEVEFYSNGNKYVLVFQGSDPAVARAINNREASVGLDYLNKVVSTDVKIGKVTVPSITALSRYLSSINTTYSVDFPLVNFLRDAPMAILSEYVYGDAKDAFAMFPYMKEAEAAVRRKLQGKATGDPMDQALEDFYNFGGPTGFAFLKDVDAFKQSIKNDVRRINQIKNPLVRMEVGFRKGLELIGQLAEWSETITRFATYLNHIDKGENKEQAALAAKNATVNFDQRGRLTGALNGLYTFFNAAIQAVDKYFKLWGKNWKKMGAIHMFLTVQGFMNAMLLDLFGGEDEDEIKNYDKVTDYTKKNNLIIPIPGTDANASFPVPQILRKFHGVGWDAYDLMSGRKTAPEVLWGQLASIPSDMSPIDTEAFLNKEGDLSVKPLVPSFFRPIAELEANENFMKLPISPEPFSLEMAAKIADTRRAYRDVNKIAQWTTDKLYELGGGDETGFKYVYKDGELQDVPALLDISPESIEHLFESYFGGVGKLVNRTWKTTANIYGAGKKLYEGEDFVNAIKEVDINVVPVANRFVRTPMGDPLQKEFKKVRNDFENKIKVLKQAEKDGDWEKFNRIYEEIGPQLEEYKAIMTTFEKIDDAKAKILKTNPAAAEGIEKEAREQMKEIIKIK